MIRILLIDDHEIVRQGLVSFLASVGDFEIVAQGATGQDAIELSLTHKPDLLILDMLLPDMTGLAAFEQIKTVAPSVKVVFLSSFCQPETVVPAVRLGAMGYLLKDIRPAELIEALRAASLGKLQLHSDVSALLVHQLNEPENDILLQHAVTEREAQVIALIGQGFSNKAIAQRLSISQLTVKTHVSRILDKLKLDDRTQVAIFAIRNHLTD